MARYNFYRHTRPDGTKRIICVSSYAGKKVRGVAICDENDRYDREKGEALARARVDLEIAKGRVKRAEGKYGEALDACDRANVVLAEMADYVDESRTAFVQAEKNLTDLLNAM